jgi:hypothetical protein
VSCSLGSTLGAWCDPGWQRGQNSQASRRGKVEKTGWPAGPAVQPWKGGTDWHIVTCGQGLGKRPPGGALVAVAVALDGAGGIGYSWYMLVAQQPA